VGGKAPKGTTITLTVSMGPESVKVTVPNLIGLTEEEGTITAIENGLEIGSVSYVYNSEVEEGNICYQSFSAGVPVDKGTKIDIKVSQGAEAVTYKCNVSITEPTPEEAPDYTTDMQVHVVLVTDDGTTLLDTTTNKFPVSANDYGLTASGGTVTLTYTVTTPGTTTTDPTTGETVTSSGSTEEKSFTRRVEFTEE